MKFHHYGALSPNRAAPARYNRHHQSRPRPLQAGSQDFNLRPAFPPPTFSLRTHEDSYGRSSQSSISLENLLIPTTNPNTLIEPRICPDHSPPPRAQRLRTQNPITKTRRPRNTPSATQSHQETQRQTVRARATRRRGPPLRLV